MADYHGKADKAGKCVDMRYISELIDSKRKIRKKENSVILEYEDRNMFVSNRKARMNLLALGDVGGTVLTGLRLLGSAAVESIGIYDLNEKLLRRYEREINQICFPDCRVLPHVEIIDEAGLFDCDMFVFCASKGVPPVGAGGEGAANPSCRTMLNLSNTLCPATSFSYVLLRLGIFLHDGLAAPSPLPQAVRPLMHRIRTCRSRTVRPHR